MAHEFRKRHTIMAAAMAIEERKHGKVTKFQQKENAKLAK